MRFLEFSLSHVAYIAIMLNKINPFYFIISFAIGLFFVYAITPPPEVIVKFPSPFNAGSITYKDKADTCYVYKADKVACPMDKKLIKPQPLFEDYENALLKKQMSESNRNLNQ